MGGKEGIKVKKQQAEFFINLLLFNIRNYIQFSAGSSFVET